MKWFILFLGLVTATSAFAWQERGNGGDAVKIKGRYYSLDLYENGVERQPSYRRKPIDAGIEKDLRASLKSDRFPIRELAVKLTQMHEQSPMFSWQIVRAMEQYTWIFVNGPLVNIEDEQDLATSHSPDQLVQAAIRSKAHIRISRPVWEKLDRANQAALLLHEMVYALTWPALRKSRDFPGEFEAFQDSSIARRVVGFWFSPEFTSGERAWKDFASSSPDIKRSIPYFSDTSRLFRFVSPYAIDANSPRHRWVRPQFFVGERHGVDFHKSSDLELQIKRNCEAGAERSLVTDIRPRITEFFRTDPGSFEHEPYEGLPKQAVYTLSWMDWGPAHMNSGMNPQIRDSESCEDYMRRFVPTEPFRD